MTDLEALMWRLDQLDPMYRSHMMLAVALDRPADPDAVVSRMGALVDRIPRLGDRVVAGPLPTVPPRWQPDPEFDLSNHLRRFQGPEADLTRVAELVAAAPLDAEHPPWSVTFVDGLEGGRQGVVLRLHHSYTDGMGAVRLAAELFDFGPDPTLDPSPSGPRRAPAAEGRPSLGQDLLEELRRTRDLLGAAGPWAAQALADAVAGRGEPAGQARSIIRSVWDDMGQFSRRQAPVMTGRSAQVRLAPIRMDLDDLRRAARQAEGTINDVFLGGLLGGLARYHDKYGPVPPTVRLGIPMSTRSGDELEMRNQLQGALLPGPLRPTDAGERIRLIHEMVLRARQQPYLSLTEPLTGLAVRIPGAVELAARALRSVDVVASNVPGPPVELYLGGSRIESMVPYGPRSGAALNATLISYAGSVFVGLNCDPAATPDVEVLVDCVEAGFGEVLG